MACALAFRQFDLSLGQLQGSEQGEYGSEKTPLTPAPQWRLGDVVKLMF
jgi:hypothetical protein